MAGNGFNIFDYVDEMKKAGMPHEQADVLAKALHGVASESAATKHDLEFAKLELKKDIEMIRQDIKNLDVRIETVRAELKQDIEMVRVELTKEIRAMGYRSTIKMGSLGLGFLGVLIAFAKFGLLSIQ